MANLISILETERLLLRPFTLNDHEFIIELLNSAAWLQFIGDRNVRTKEEALAYLQNGPLKSYRENGFGLALLQLKPDMINIGMSGIIKRDYLDAPDIGFALLPEYMGKGLAYEIAEALVVHAMSDLKIKQLSAIVTPENINSRRLIERLGFRFVEIIKTPDTREELFLYKI